MLRESSIAFHSLGYHQALGILEGLGASRTPLLPIRKAVKVFCRMTSESLFTYAREVCDLGTLVISKEEISSRLKDVSLQQRVLSALRTFEVALSERWPFMHGSHSWLEIEISTERKDVFINRAVRLTSLGKENVETTRLSTKVLKSVKLSLHEEWSIRLSERYVTPIEEESLRSYREKEVKLNMIASEMMSQNACPLGFYMYSDIGKIRVASSVMAKERHSLTLPIVGVLK